MCVCVCVCVCVRVSSLCLPGHACDLNRTVHWRPKKVLRAYVCVCVCVSQEKSDVEPELTAPLTHAYTQLRGLARRTAEVRVTHTHIHTHTCETSQSRGRKRQGQGLKHVRMCVCARVCVCVCVCVTCVQVCVSYGLPIEPEETVNNALHPGLMQVCNTHTHTHAQRATEVFTAHVPFDETR